MAVVGINSDNKKKKKTETQNVYFTLKKNFQTHF